jgi:hypothetical protein
MTGTGNGSTRASTIPPGGVSATCGAAGCGGGDSFRTGFGLGLTFGFALFSTGKHGGVAALASAVWVASLLESSGFEVVSGGDSGGGSADAGGGTALSPVAGAG